MTGYFTETPARLIYFIVVIPFIAFHADKLLGIILCETIAVEVTVITARVAKRAKVMFLQACVTHSVQRGGGRWATPIVNHPPPPRDQVRTSTPSPQDQVRTSTPSPPPPGDQVRTSTPSPPGPGQNI